MANQIMPTEAEMRAEFERQHEGRNLTKHRMRGTYFRAEIAALWNQHKRTVNWMMARTIKPEQADTGEKTP